MENIEFKRLDKIEKLDLNIAECEILDLEKFIEDKNNYAFVSIKDNKAIAFLYGYGMLRPDGKRMFYIHSVDVISECQSKGIGTSLMEFTLDYVKKENKYYKFFVLTEEDNIKACKLYQKYANRDEQVLFSNEI